MRFNFHLPYCNFHLPIKNSIFYDVSFKTKSNMVLACESIFSRTSLDARPQNNMHTFSKVKYIKHTLTVGQARCGFHLPFSYDLQILLAWGNRASTNVKPCLKYLEEKCQSKVNQVIQYVSDLTNCSHLNTFPPNHHISHYDDNLLSS